MSEAFIKCQNLCYNYDANEKNEALKNVNLQIDEGEFVAILGHNGSGKSTLAKHFNAILTPSSGNVTVDGIDTCDESRVFDIRSRVGMVFQNPDNQIVATVVEEDVAFALENLGVEPDEIRRRVDSALRAVDMYDYRSSQPHKLSGGQKQRVAIAGVLAMSPKCIVLDEPTAMLDPKGREQVMQCIKKMRQEQSITVVLITHFMDEAAQSDRVVVMDSGEVVMNAPPREVFKRAAELKKIGLDVPEVCELCQILKENGVDIPLAITPEECIRELSALLK